MFRLIFPVLFLFLAFHSHSQIRFSDAGLIVESRYIWRGEKLGTAPAIEPSLTFASGRFSFNFWATASIDKSYSEIDLTPAWQFDEFALSLLDYYYPVPGENNQYFNFQGDKNRHSLELSIDNYAVEKRRLKWMIGAFLLGDRNEETGKSFYSTYLEFKYPFTIWSIETEPFLGLTPFHGYYADRFAFINTGISFSKDLDLKLPFSIPLSLSFISNPYTKQSFVIFAGGIAF
ncbi:MAG: hypothetical protein Q8N05_13590 [Bacteroidota bacterium]|nr:hypothetical protein [Bacteroidota bacterium]